MKPMGKKEFYSRVYLRSIGWKQRSLAYKKRVGWLCERCFIRPTAIVHHLNYDNLGHEEPQDLISLCAVCHAEMHDWPKPANDNQLMLALDRPKAS